MASSSNYGPKWIFKLELFPLLILIVQLPRSVNIKRFMEGPVLVTSLKRS